MIVLNYIFLLFLITTGSIYPNSYCQYNQVKDLISHFIIYISEIKLILQTPFYTDKAQFTTPMESSHRCDYPYNVTELEKCAGISLCN